MTFLSPLRFESTMTKKRARTRTAQRIGTTLHDGIMSNDRRGEERAVVYVRVQVHTC